MGTPLQGAFTLSVAVSAGRANLRLLSGNPFRVDVTGGIGFRRSFFDKRSDFVDYRPTVIERRGVREYGTTPFQRLNHLNADYHFYFLIDKALLLAQIFSKVPRKALLLPVFFSKVPRKALLLPLFKTFGRRKALLLSLFKTFGRREALLLPAAKTFHLRRLLLDAQTEAARRLMGST